MAESVAERVERKLEQQGLSPRRASLEATGGRDADMVRDMIRRGRIPKGDGMAKLAALLATTQEWLLYGGDEEEWAKRIAEQDPLVRTEVADGQVSDRQTPWRAGEPQPKLVPLLGSAMGGEYGNVDEHVELTELHLAEVLEWLARPPELREDPAAYTLRVVGDSMSPVFEPGYMVNVSPRSSVAIGDNVIVQLRGAGEAEDARVKMVLLKKLKRRTTAFIELEQYNPPIVFQVPVDRVVCDGRGAPAIHKVASVRF